MFSLAHYDELLVMIYVRAKYSADNIPPNVRETSELHNTNAKPDATEGSFVDSTLEHVVVENVDPTTAGSLGKGGTKKTPSGSISLKTVKNVFRFASTVKDKENL